LPFRDESLKTLSDLQLVIRYTKTNEKSCVGILFERYSTLVYSVCLKYLSDKEESKDASMQIFEKLLDDLKKHSITNFRSWLHSVAKNHCLMHLRKNKHIREIGGDAAELLIPIMEYKNFSHPEETDLKETNLTELENGLLKLNLEQKQCIELFYLQEKSYVEIANMTGFSINNVKSYIQNGKRNLKNLITLKNV
jgi:RNA polymerase sigma factor (sigma-70 family)